MDEEKIEETNENPEEEETSEEETSPEEKDTPKEETKETYTERERKYYARMKDAEEARKKAKEELAKAKEDLAKAKIPISDVDAILEVQTATSGLDPDEVGELKFRASTLGTKLSDARQDKNFLLWQKAHREEVEKLQAAKPTTIAPEEEKPKTVFDEAKGLKGEGIRKDFANLKDKEAFLEKHGLWEHPRKARRTESFSVGPQGLNKS